MTDPDLDHLLRWVQQGVVSRRQIEGMGGRHSDIRRMIRRRELTSVHPGVYVNHTGRLTRGQREWAAVLAAWPAALTDDSALPRPTSPAIHIAVHPGRTLEVPPFVVPHRTAHLDDLVDWRAGPPTVQLEHALVNVMSQHLRRQDVEGAYAALTSTAFTRRTTPDRVISTLGSRARVAGRALITEMAQDLRDGACSVLERGYLHRVERPHGLPRADRQVRSTATGSATYQDVRYSRYGLIIELDGRGYHDNPKAWDDDARRDLAGLASSEVLTARVTYGLVFREQCRTAVWIATILGRRGWGGELRRCPECPPR
ncbi:hypothetical protein F0U47_18515 [Nocardioides antri]|uniref:Type IV toxin-antitoxin system AbiEi family antitoxin domain-containing protein n=1 Tax=Nocardioides antri TaxID=2607659 RepID=A0A5B1LX78_9ACTN|nr:hypothetical protein F0U47_18515 [Nocardioides antri]